MKEALILFFVLLFGCGGEAGAKPCIPIDVVQIRTLGNGITASFDELTKILLDGQKLFNRNFSFAEICHTSRKEAWYPPAAYQNVLENYMFVFYYWFNTFNFKYGRILLAIHPTPAGRYVAGLSITRSYLDPEFPGFAFAWCGKNKYTCEQITIHEILHTLGAKHLAGVNVMNRYVGGKDYLKVFPRTKTQVRRYLKRKGVL